MKFPREALAQLAADDTVEGFELIEDKIVGATIMRGEVAYRMIFRTDDTRTPNGKLIRAGKFYSVEYTVGLCDIYSPFEREEEMVECTEVEQIEESVLLTYYLEV